jgi:hypothetical protein
MKRSAGGAIEAAICRPFRAGVVSILPSAYALGCILSPLRGFFSDIAFSTLYLKLQLRLNHSTRYSVTGVPRWVTLHIIGVGMNYQ